MVFTIKITLKIKRSTRLRASYEIENPVLLGKISDAELDGNSEIKRIRQFGKIPGNANRNQEIFRIAGFDRPEDVRNRPRANQKSKIGGNWPRFEST